MENAPSLTTYRNLVYKVYNTYYAKYYSYLEDDLIQCGYWGLFLAFQKFDSSRSDNFVSYAYKRIQNKMWQYIDHEKHHITKDLGVDYDFNKVGYFKDITTKIDLINATTQLTPKEQHILLQWLNNATFDKMGFKSKQLAHYHFKNILEKIKRKLV